MTLQRLRNGTASPMLIAKAAVLLRRRANSLRRRSLSDALEESGGARPTPLPSPGSRMEPPPSVANLPAQEAGIVLGRHLLLQRLCALGLQQVSVRDDGACQFRAFSQQLYGTEEYHRTIRYAVVDHIGRERGYFGAMFDEGEFDLFLSSMRRSRSWGDEITLRAFADCYQCVVHVITSTDQHWHLQYEPQQQPPAKQVFLTYLSPVHYDALTATPPLDVDPRTNIPSVGSMV